MTLHNFSPPSPMKSHGPRSLTRQLGIQPLLYAYKEFMEFVCLLLKCALRRIQRMQLSPAATRDRLRPGGQDDAVHKPLNFRIPPISALPLQPTHVRIACVIHRECEDRCNYGLHLYNSLSTPFTPYGVQSPSQSLTFTHSHTH